MFLLSPFYFLILILFYFLFFEVLLLSLFLVRTLEFFYSINKLSGFPIIKIKITPKMQNQRIKQQQQQALMQQALLQQQSLYHPGLLAAPQVPIFVLCFIFYSNRYNFVLICSLRLDFSLSWFRVKVLAFNDHPVTLSPPRVLWLQGYFDWLLWNCSYYLLMNFDFHLKGYFSQLWEYIGVWRL